MTFVLQYLPGVLLLSTGCSSAAALAMMTMGPPWPSEATLLSIVVVVFGLSTWIALKMHPVVSFSIGLFIWVLVPGVPRFMGPPHGGGNEGSAIGALRAINASQQAYASSCGGGGYASLLEDLNKAPQAGGPAFISPDLSHNGVMKSAYVIILRPGPGAQVVTPAAKTCNDAADTVSTYFAEAHPETYGTSGTRSFATTEKGVIYEIREAIVMQPQDLARARPIQ